MSKQILISRNDFGIVFEIQLIDKDKKPVIINSDNVNMYIVNPLMNKLVIENIPVVDSEKGLCNLVLSPEHTENVGNHAVYVELKNQGYVINTVLAFYYYVVPRHGGAN